jgi:ATP-dependent Zn protease
MEKHHKFSIWYVLLGVWAVLIIQNYLASAFAIKTVPYSEFLNLLKKGKVAEVAITANQIQGKLKDEAVDNGKKTLFLQGPGGIHIPKGYLLMDLSHISVYRCLVFYHETDDGPAAGFYDPGKK